MREAFARTGGRSLLDTLIEGLRRTAEIASERSAAGPVEESRTARRQLLPDRAAGEDELLAELERVARGAVAVGDPGWMGHMDPPPTWTSVLGASAGALLNNNMLTPEMSPSFTELEEEVVQGFAHELGFGPEARGTLTAGGTIANLLALLVARNDRLAREPVERHEALSRLTIVTSADAHISISKAAMILGLDPGRGVLLVDPDRTGRLDPDVVSDAIDAAEAEGRVCFAVVATAGTTVLGAIDPLAPLARVASQRDAWYHVDAAYAGALALSPTRRAVLSGIEEADSVTLAPQKWLYVAKACALILFGDGSRWARAARSSLPYALPGAPGDAPSLRVEGTRSADILKLRLSLWQLGRSGCEELFTRCFEMAAGFEARVRDRPFLELAAPRSTNIVVFRCVADASGDDPSHTEALQGRLLERAGVFLSLPVYREGRWLRAVLLNPFTETATIDGAFALIDEFARERGWTP